MTYRAKPLATVLTSLALTSLVACSGASSSAAAPATSTLASSAPAAQAATAQPPSCSAQVTDWVTTGGGATLPTFGSDSAAFADALEALAADMEGSGPTAADTSAVQTAAASLQSDTEALEASPGPSCVPGLADNVSAAARDYATAAIDADNSINQLSAGAMGVATDDLVTANSVLDKGNAKLEAAVTAAKAFTVSSSSS